MMRDMDLVRQIALEVADMPPQQQLASLDDVDPHLFAFHVALMKEAGLVVANIQEYLSGEAPRVRVVRLTWEGCEFVDAIKDDTLWAKAKTNVMQPAMSFTFEFLKDWLKTEISQGFPTLRV
ncbi:MAG: DUF2513 domain-containing protein [Burkholderiaceae bacterium]